MYHPKGQRQPALLRVLPLLVDLTLTDTYRSARKKGHTTEGGLHVFGQAKRF